MSLSRHLLQWVYGCAICGRSPSGPMLLGCEWCLSELEQRSLVRPLFVGPNRSPLWSRWIWKKGERGNRVGALIHGLKGGGRGKDITLRIAEGLDLYNVLKEFKATPIWIPAPPRKPGAADHAHLWAQALQATYGGFIWAGLRRKADRGVGPQKKADRSQRWKLSFELCADREPLPNGVPIFCDDVVTTGATWNAAQKLILPTSQGPLPGVVIAYRPLVNRG